MKLKLKKMSVEEYNAAYPHLAFSNIYMPDKEIISVYVSEENPGLNSMLKTTFLDITLANGSVYRGIEYGYVPLTSAGFAAGWTTFSTPTGAFMKFK